MSWSINYRNDIVCPCTIDCKHRSATCHSAECPFGYLEYERKKHALYNGEYDDYATKHDKYFNASIPTSAAKQRRVKEHMRKLARKRGGYRI